MEKRSQGMLHISLKSCFIDDSQCWCCRRALPHPAALPHAVPTMKLHCCILTRASYHWHIMIGVCTQEWQLKSFQPFQMPSWLYESYFQGDSQLPKMSNLKEAEQTQWPFLCIVYIPGVTVPCCFTQKPDEKHWVLNQLVSSQTVVLYTAVTPWIEPWLAVLGRIAGLKPLTILKLPTKLL